MWDRDSPGLRRVFELFVTAYVGNLVPAIPEQMLDDHPAVHVLLYTLFTHCYE